MVELLWNPSLVAALVSAIALGLFSVGVGILAKFRGPARWYAVFGIAFSSTVVLGNIAEAVEAAALLDSPNITRASFFASAALNGGQWVLAGIWMLGTIRLLECYGTRPDRWVVAIGAAIAMVATIPGIFELWNWGFGVSDRPGYFAWYYAYVGAEFLRNGAIGVMGAGGFLLARARLRSHQSGQAILAAAMTAYPLSWPVWIAVVVGIEGSWYGWIGIISLVSFVGLSVGWLRVLHRTADRTALGVVGTASAFFGGSFVIGFTFGVAFSPSTIARTFDLLLVAYAILRLQYLGLDVKIRWGLSKSTVAAAFVAVFFIASEVAQQFFGDRFNNNYVGIGAAGLLVLGIAPLQRMADRFASTAVPVTTATGGRVAAVDVYRHQVQQAWADGRIAPDERRMLRRLRQDLGMNADEADQIEDAVEVGLSKQID